MEDKRLAGRDLLARDCSRSAQRLAGRILQKKQRLSEGFPK